MQSLVVIILWGIVVIQCFITIHCQSTTCIGPISQSQFNSLNELYVVTNGPNWQFNTSLPTTTIWSFPNSISAPCTNNWQGLTCLESGASSCIITELALSAFNLQGTLPASINGLSSLILLDLQENFLTGAIPSLTILPLIQLRLPQNNFTGVIPTSLSNLTNLLVLDLSDNDLSGVIPTTIGKIVSMEELALQSNYLTGSIPAEISNLTGAIVISVDDNLLTGPIPDLISFDSLVDWTMSSNSMSGILPTVVGTLGVLKNFDISSNCFTGILPTELGLLQSLESLQVDDNSFTGTIPATIGQLNSLIVLDMDSNFLEANIPSELGQLSFLTFLDTGFNILTGSIPSTLSLLTMLGTLSLASNQLSGSIPSALPALESLQSLALNENCLTGELPVGLFLLPGLIVSDFTQNLFTGVIPTAVGEMKALTALFVGSNFLSGSIPVEIANTSSLASFDATINFLDGTIPSDIGLLTGLQSFAVGTNLLSGTIPSSLENLKNMVNLDLNTNALSGTLPNFSGLTNLQSLSLFSNILFGIIPAAYGDLSFLTSLSVGLNLLSGEIPNSLSHLINLQELELDNNEFSGTLPSGLGNITSIVSLDISSNILSGPIPDEFVNLVNMQTFLASDNLLSGTLSGSLLKSFENMSTLEIQVNNFYGTIPEEIGDLTSMISLNFFDNCFDGKLPESLMKINTFSAVSFTSNYFTGQIPSLASQDTLFSFSVNDNFFSGTIPDSLGEHTLLNSLLLNFNPELTGPLPPSIVNMTLLRFVTGYYNGFFGSLPSQLGALDQLLFLDLSGNNLSGSIPDNFAEMIVQAQVIALRENDLTGVMPSSLGSSSNLMQLSLSENKFSGSIPPMALPAISMSVHGLNAYPFKMVASAQASSPPTTPVTTFVADSIAENLEFHSTFSSPEIGFGNSVALLGSEWLFVGDSLAGNNTGAVLVYAFNKLSSRWEHSQILVGEAPNSNFGASIAVRNYELVIGATGTGYFNGSAAVYSLHNVTNSWTLYQSLSFNETNSYFGTAIALDSMLAISANGFGRTQGAVQIYSTTTLGAWSFVQSLNIYNMDSYSCFGSVLAMRNRTLAVGAYCYGNYQGAVIIYRYDEVSGEWVQSITISPEASNRIFFGYSLALTRKSILIGAYGYARGAGIVQEFIWDESTISAELVQELTLEDSSPNDWFGSFLVQSGGVLFVAATGPGPNGEALYGFFYNQNAEKWELQQVVSIEGSASLGVAFALSNDTLVVGSMQSQSVFLFNYTTQATMSPTPMPSRVPSPTYSPTMSIGVTFVTTQIIVGVNYSAFKSTYNSSILSLRQAVAGSINATGITYLNVLINSVVPNAVSRRLQGGLPISASQQSSVTTVYTVSTTNAQGFTSSSAAFAAYTTSLNKAVSSNLFNNLLSQSAARNGAAGLNNVTAEQPSYEALFPTASPTAAPYTSNGELSDGEIAGIVIGCLAFVSILLASFYVFVFRKNQIAYNGGTSSVAVISNAGTNPIISPNMMSEPFRVNPTNSPNSNGKLNLDGANL